MPQTVMKYRLSTQVPQAGAKRRAFGKSQGGHYRAQSLNYVLYEKILYIFHSYFSGDRSCGPKPKDRYAGDYGRYALFGREAFYYLVSESGLRIADDVQRHQLFLFYSRLSTAFCTYGHREQAAGTFFGH